MMTTEALKTISGPELDDVLERARDEGWTSLALVSRGDWASDELRQLAPGRVYIVDDLPQSAVRRISRLTQLSFLALVDLRIGDEGARALAALTGLTSLDLSNNGIGDDGARALAALTGLTSLTLWDNKIGEEGARALAALTGLTSLDLGSNGIGDEAARALAALTGLTSLDLESNEIGDEGARALTALTGLTALDLASNEIGDEGARALTALTGLTSLDLSNNGIGDEGARALAALTGLTSLKLWNNKIGEEGARALAALTGLTSLDLENNRIGDEGARALLDPWSDRPSAGNLSYLNLRENGDLSSLLPAEALETHDVQAILAAYRRYRSAAEQETLRPLNEAKLLVVGNEAVGKTSLIRYLVENKPRDPDEKKTPGAAIHEKINTQQWAGGEDAVTLNIWDFGGQEIMRETHRYFLTERSLYLLVLEDRRQDDRSVYDWLKIIRHRGRESPVIVVINKSDEGKQDLRLNESGLKQDYPALIDFVRTSCDPGEFPAASIRKLRGVIADTLATDERLKHVRSPIPQPWLRVKNAVAEMAREKRVLERRAFERLCEQPDGESGAENTAITDADEQRALLRLLHELGVVVAHGLERDAPSARREITLLDPNWLTGAIYTLLNSETVRDQGGEFARDQMESLLDPGIYPKDWHEFILGMMQDDDVGLCLRLTDADHERYLVPEALPENQPNLDVWKTLEPLRFRYEYSFLPRGLIPRFIVQAHRNLTENPTRWRDGVLLEAAGCTVLVRRDRDNPRIEIEVAGPTARRRAALNVVLNDLDHVHQRNPETRPEARVPLPGQPEVSVGYEHLLRLEERRGLDYEFLPEGADLSYTVRELLEGVRLDFGRQETIVKNVKNVIKFDHSTFHGDVAVAVAKKIEGSFNKAGVAASPDDIKAVLQQLAQEVAKLAEKLSEAEAADVADDLERLTDEATKDKPRRKWWELSAEGILEAAKSVGELGTTAIGLVEKLRAVLSG